VKVAKSPRAGLNRYVANFASSQKLFFKERFDFAQPGGNVVVVILPSFDDESFYPWFDIIESPRQWQT
jgi:hypothetical protein